MLEILESLATVVIMVPVMIALLLGSIYGLGELFNLFSAVGGKNDAEIMFEGRNAPDAGLKYRCQEITRSLMYRFIQHLFCRPRFYHFPLIHKDDLVRHFAGKTDFMRHHHHSHARVRQAFHHLQHFANQFGIERRSGLIEQ